MPLQVAAGHHAAMGVHGFMGTHPRTGRYFSCTDTANGGATMPRSSTPTLNP